MTAQIFMFLPMAQLPNNIRRIRKEKGWTLERLALDINCSIPQVSGLERGTTALTLDWMDRIARAMDVSVADLLADHHNPDRLEEQERNWLERWRAADEDERDTLSRVADAVQPFRHEPRRTGTEN